MRLLLDTCTLLWLEFELAKVPENLASRLKRVETEIFVSVVSGWEIAIKQRLGKFPSYPPDLASLLHASCIINRITILPISWQHASAAGSLSLHHKDPFDRLLVAQAQVENLVLVSPDPAFGPYDVEMLWD
jgi:PIN domain nuclease of toxin-antitoxin system